MLTNAIIYRMGWGVPTFSVTFLSHLVYCFYLDFTFLDDKQIENGTENGIGLTIKPNSLSLSLSLFLVCY